MNMYADDLEDVVKSTVGQFGLAAEDFMVEALKYGLSFDTLERRLNINGKVVPFCRNTFYRKKRIIIGVIEERR